MTRLFAERDASILAALKAEGATHRSVAADFGVTIHIVRNAIKFGARAGALVPARPQGVAATYEAMLGAIEACKSALDAQEIIGQADALRVYAHQAKNRDAEIDCAELRIRAERKLGAIIVAQKETVGLAKGGRPPSQPDHRRFERLMDASSDARLVLGDGSVLGTHYEVLRDELGWYWARKTGSSGEPVLSRVTLADAGIDKKLSMRAQKLAKLPEDEFAWQLSGWRKSASEEGARVSVRLLKGQAQQDKKQARANREEILGRRQLAAPEPIYGVILEDFEWDYEVRSRLTGMDRHASNHYPTAAAAHTPEEIVARTEERFRSAAPDCFLAMWVPVPHLAIGLKVMELRGFKYVSGGVWVKYRPGGGIGMGHWLRVDHELLLFGVRGHIPCPAEGDQRRSVFDIPATRTHSEKPDDVAEMLEQYFPTLPKIELNRRGPARAGWSAWGNEAEESQAGPRGTDGEGQDADGSAVTSVVQTEGPERSPRLEARAAVDAGAAAPSSDDDPVISRFLLKDQANPLAREAVAS